MFQFHFGSIGSTDNNAIDYQTEVSIPLWFDWKNSVTINRISVDYVSIPLWFDWKPISQFKEYIIFDVSIPLWFDWKCSPSYQTRYLLVFQFHFGSIGSSKNSQKSRGKHVSIPLWFDWKGFWIWRLLDNFDVSIPLWFDWKLLVLQLQWLIITSFNSTLVRLEGLCFWNW